MLGVWGGGGGVRGGGRGGSHHNIMACTQRTRASILHIQTKACMHCTCTQHDNCADRLLPIHSSNTTIYRCPSISKDEDTRLHKVITHASRDECLIMGDLNHSDIRWNSLDSSNESAKFLLLVQNCFLTQHVLEPARGDNVLYLILSSNKELVDNVRVVEPLGTSDHSQSHFNLTVKTDSRYSKQRKRDFKKGDYVQMRSYLENMKWAKFLENKTAEQCWESSLIT